jgi:Tol biopolymer transport system component
VRTAVTVATLVTAISALWCSPAEAAFPGANGKLAFVKNLAPSTEADEIFSIDPDGSNQTQLTANTVGDGFPAWSADGAKIAFRRSVPAPLFNQIYVMGSDGNGASRVPTDVGSFVPEWSPDGTRIAFQGEVGDGCCVIYTMQADGSNLQNFSQLGVHDTSPTWSPNGHEIAFASGFGAFGYTSEIYKKTVDALVDPVRITNNTYDDIEPDWSPDGSKIAFASSRGGSYDIYVMDGAGNNQTRITSDAASEFEPAWSPDGSKIAFVSTRDGSEEVYVMNADGSAQTRITDDSRDDFSPDWQPNQSPDCSTVQATPDSLSPANRRFRIVSLAGATDPDGDTPTLSIDGVTQDEPLRGQGDHTSPDAVLTGSPSDVRLRAETRRRGDGRVYRIAFTASDGRGGTCSGTASVEVPVRRGLPAVDSAPPSYDSLGG